MYIHSLARVLCLELFEAEGLGYHSRVMINVQSGEMDTDKQSVFVCFKMIAPKSIFLTQKA